MLDDLVDRIPGGAGNGRDDRAIGPGELVEQRGLAHVGMADDGDFDFLALSPRLTALGNRVVGPWFPAVGYWFLALGSWLLVRIELEFAPLFSRFLREGGDFGSVFSSVFSLPSVVKVCSCGRTAMTASSNSSTPRPCSAETGNIPRIPRR